MSIHHILVRNILAYNPLLQRWKLADNPWFCFDTRRSGYYPRLDFVYSAARTRQGRLGGDLSPRHVIWTGVERPTPRDVSKLLSVRPSALPAALWWLCLQNHHYADIVINEDEMGGWSFEEGGEVPALAYQRMVWEGEAAKELTRTGQIVPPADRRQDPPRRESTVEDIVAQLVEKLNCSPDQCKPVYGLRHLELGGGDGRRNVGVGL